MLMVGVDSAVGKKYAALAIHHAFARRGMAAAFRATGQPGILIAGTGIATDAVVAAFAPGPAATPSPEPAPGPWDVLTGQGSLFHQAPPGRTLAPLHDARP